MQLGSPARPAGRGNSSQADNGMASQTPNSSSKEHRTKWILGERPLKLLVHIHAHSRTHEDVWLLQLGQNNVSKPNAGAVFRTLSVHVLAVKG